MPTFIENLRNKPYQTRLKILWLIVVIAGIFLLAIWALTLKTSVKQVTKDPEDIQSLTQRTEDVVKIEYLENDAKGLKIYFNITNSSDDILNFPDLADISLNVRDSNYTPKNVLDRQSHPFVHKILSHTTNFGILVFEPLAGDEGTLVFDQMFYDKKSEDIFKDESNLNFEELNQANKLRE